MKSKKATEARSCRWFQFLRLNDSMKNLPVVVYALFEGSLENIRTKCLLKRWWWNLTSEMRLECTALLNTVWVTSHIQEGGTAFFPSHYSELEVATVVTVLETAERPVVCSLLKVGNHRWQQQLLFAHRTSQNKEIRTQWSSLIWRFRVRVWRWSPWCCRQYALLKR
jgi:hypothetical protein